MITAPEIEAYLDEKLVVNDPLLCEMEAHAKKHGFPYIGPQVGRLLEILAATTGARRIFELGSGFGYSAYWFCKGMGPAGKIDCTDMRQDNADYANDIFSRAGIADQLTFHIGDACQSLYNSTSGPYDIILIDIDKHGYMEALDVALAKLRPGGLIIADNLLWNGAVVDPDDRPSTQAVVNFNSRIMNAPELTSMILPIRDGVGLCWYHPDSAKGS